MKNISKTTLVYFFILGVALILLVFPDYFGLDEPNILWYIRMGRGWTVSFRRFVSEGRAVYGVFQIWSFTVMGKLSNLKYMRAISIIAIFSFSRMIYNYIKSKEVAPAVALIISVMIFSLPGITAIICWGQSYLLITAAIISFYAGTLLVKVFSKHLGYVQLSIARENALLFFAVTLQIFSLFIYQGLALALVVPPFIMLITHSDITLKKRMVFFIMTGFYFALSLGIYYEIFHSVLASSHINMIGRGKIGGFNISGKAVWFAYVLKDAIKLHLLLFKNTIINNTFSIIIIGLLIRDLIKKRFSDLFFLAACSIMVFIPHLIIAESWGASRNFMLISLLLIIYCTLRAFEIIPVPSVKISGLTGIFFIGIMSFNMYEGWVKPMHEDYTILYSFAKQMPTVSKDTLMVIVTPPQRNLHEKNSLLKCYYDEFLTPEFYIGWPIEPGIKCLYQDTHPEISAVSIDRLIQVQMDSVKIPANETRLKKVILNLNYK